MRMSFDLPALAALSAGLKDQPVHLSSAQTATVSIVQRSANPVADLQMDGGADTMHYVPTPVDHGETLPLKAFELVENSTQGRRATNAVRRANDNAAPGQFLQALVCIHV